MSYNIIDIIIVIFLLIGFVTGFKRGFVKQGVITAGTFLVVILAFIFKNPLSIVLYEHCPFFASGILKNYSVLNILLYELISFFILLSIFSLIFAIIVKISGVLERLVRATIILALPSKLLGGLLGVIESFIFSFIVLLIITLPITNFSTSKYVTESKLKDYILNKSLVLSKAGKSIVKSANSVNDLIKDKKNLGKKEFNCKALNVFIDNKIVSKDSVDYLKENNKIDKSCEIN